MRAAEGIHEKTALLTSARLRKNGHFYPQSRTPKSPCLYRRKSTGRGASLFRRSDNMSFRRNDENCAIRAHEFCRTKIMEIYGPTSRRLRTDSPPTILRGETQRLVNTPKVAKPICDHRKVDLRSSQCRLAIILFVLSFPKTFTYPYPHGFRLSVSSSS